jgi:hypothetical protein
MPPEPVTRPLLQASSLAVVSAASAALIGRAATVVVVAIILIGLLLFALSDKRVRLWLRERIRRLRIGDRIPQPRLSRALSKWLRGASAARAKQFRTAAAVVSIPLALGAAYTVGVRHDDADDGARAREVLLKLLVPKVRKLCRGSEDKPDDALAQVRCRDPKANITATFTRFASPAVLKRAIGDLKAATGAPPGSCFRQAVAVATYDLEDAPNAGELLCDADGTTQSIAWTNETFVVLGEARQEGTHTPSLLEWWSDRNAALTSSGLRRPFPDELERRLVERVPDSFRKTCRRDTYTVEGSQATVRCSPRSGDYDVWYLRFAESEDLERTVRQRSKGWRDVKGSCSLRKEEPAVSTYRDGTRICYNQSGASWVEWSDDEALIYAFARVKPPDLYPLFSWWRQDGGPL